MLGVYLKEHFGVDLLLDAKEVRPLRMAGAVYLVALHAKLVKSVVDPLLVQDHFLIVRLACGMDIERAGRRFHVDKRCKAKVSLRAGTCSCSG